MLGLALVGCGGQDAAWTLQHGTFDLGQDGIAGYQVWELFSERWGKSRDQRHHVCANVQELVGDAVTSLPGCVGCSVTFQVATPLLEHDCGVAPSGLDGVTHFSFGPVPSDLQADEPHIGNTLGWYASFDGVELEPMGYAWNEALDHGETPNDDGLVAGERYVFWPAWAWDLSK